MAYKMTARRRAALRKAQAASARKRRKGSRGRKYAKRAAIGYGVAAGISTGAMYYLGTQIGAKTSRAKNLGQAARAGAKLPGILAFAGARGLVGMGARRATTSRRRKKR